MKPASSKLDIGMGSNTWNWTAGIKTSMQKLPVGHVSQTVNPWYPASHTHSVLLPLPAGDSEWSWHGRQSSGDDDPWVSENELAGHWWTSPPEHHVPATQRLQLPPGGPL
eukprot:536831-Rhodomonas_salina.2